MSTPFPLQPLLDLEALRTDVASRQLALLLSQDIAVENKLQLLTGYRSNYQERLQVTMREGLAGSEWRNYQQFMSRLDQAIAQQQDLLDAARERVASGRDKLQMQQRKQESFDTLAQRHRQQQAVEEQRREQRLQDEYTSVRQHYGNPTWDAS